MNTQAQRIITLASATRTAGEYVLYWMQSAQRVHANQALEHAVSLANERMLPVVVLFVLIPAYQDANLRHFNFMLQGLAETAGALQQRRIPLCLDIGEPVATVLAHSTHASVIVTDSGRLRMQHDWRIAIARRAACPVVMIETDTVVPTACALDRGAWNAAQLRRRITPLLPDLLVPVHAEPLRCRHPAPTLPTLDPQDTADLVTRIAPDRSVGPVAAHGGHAVACRLLDTFIERHLDSYHLRARDPAAGCRSQISPYLHFGQISPVEIAIKIRDHGGPGAEAFLEELIVRRELAINFVVHNSAYDRWEGLPGRAQKTLQAHAGDLRSIRYTLVELEHCRTHDPYWNAAMREMRLTGRMHGYMRMYWGKMVIRWSATPREAFTRLLYLNNRYFLDGRDPSSYAGVAWCFGTHDRPWKERSILGTVRCMTADGLRRKFDMDRYLRRIAAIPPDKEETDACTG